MIACLLTGCNKNFQTTLLSANEVAISSLQDQLKEAIDNYDVYKVGELLENEDFNINVMLTTEELGKTSPISYAENKLSNLSSKDTKLEVSDKKSEIPLMDLYKTNVTPQPFYQFDQGEGWPTLFFDNIYFPYNKHRLKEIIRLLKVYLTYNHPC